MHSLIGMNIRLFRIKYRLDLNDIIKQTKLSRDALYKVEQGKLFGKSFVSYILYLKTQDADLNEIFDINTNEKLKR